MKRFVYLFRYIKLLKRNKEILENSRIDNNPSGIKYDWLYRLYTVLNIPPSEEQNIRRYGYYFIDNAVKNHIAKMNDFLLQLGILEFVRIDTKNVIQIDEYNIKIVLRFKWLNLKTLFRSLIFIAPLLLIIILVVILAIL